MQREHFIADVTIDSSVDTTVTTATQVPAWARYGSVYIPAITNAAVTVQIMEERRALAATITPDIDTDWVAYADEAESSQVAASGVENTWVDISHFIKAMPRNCFMRFVQGAAETGGSALTYRLSFRGA